MAEGDARIGVVVASGNRGKLAEIRAILDPEIFLVGSLDDWPAVEFPEEGDDYAENAAIKALTVARHTGEIAVADDSGLEVDALKGAPGPYSARYGGPHLDDAGRIRHLLDNLVGVPPEGRSARFVCFAAAASPDARTRVTRGTCEGRILEAPRGGAGFGYDPIFQPSGHEGSMADLSPREKDEISHRGQAFRALAQRLPSLVVPPRR